MQMLNCILHKCWFLGSPILQNDQFIVLNKLLWVLVPLLIFNRASVFRNKELWYSIKEMDSSTQVVIVGMGVPISFYGKA